MHKFIWAENRSAGLPGELKHIEKELSIGYFDAGSVTASSKVDGIHLDEPSHGVFGKAIAKVVLERGLLYQTTEASFL